MIGPTELSLCSKQLERLIPGVAEVHYDRLAVAGSETLQVSLSFRPGLGHSIARRFDPDLQFLRGRILRVMEKAAKGEA